MIHRTQNKSTNEVVDKIIPKSKEICNANPLSKDKKFNVDQCTVIQTGVKQGKQTARVCYTHRFIQQTTLRQM